MYIFRPIPITTCNEKWLMYSSVNVSAYSAPSYDPSEWSGSYDLNAEVSRYGYDFISLKDSNTDDPYRNFVGRSPRSDDTVNNYGKGTWTRKQATNKTRCFLPEAAGYTESYGTYTASINPGEANDYPELTLMPQEKLTLLCNGVVGSQLSVQTMNFAGGTISGSTKTVIMVQTNPEIDFLINPELPSNAKAFLYSANAGLSSEDDWQIADAFKFSITPTSSAFSAGNKAFIENAFLGRLNYIGKSQWTNHNLSTNDRSRVTIDDWGVATVSKRRVSKDITGEVIITPDIGKSIATKIVTILKFLMYIRGSINVFILSNQDIKSVSNNVLTEIAYADTVTAMLKDFKISNISASKAVVNITISTIPTGYRV